MNNRRKDSFFMHNLNDRKEAVIVFILALILMLAGIWAYPITILDEAKNAGAAREMFQGNSLFPTFNGILRTDKPPLHYFFMQLGYFIFGVNELGARFFGSLLGAGFMARFYIFLRKYSTLTTARLATFILLSAFFWVQEFHLAVPDPFLLVFLCGSWLLFFDLYQQTHGNARQTETQCGAFLRDTFGSADQQETHGRASVRKWMFYAFVGLATLAKGPVAIGLTGLIVLIYLIYCKRFTWAAIRSFRPISGGLLVLLIATPWFLWMHGQTDGAFTEGFFIKHNFSRFGSEMEGHGGIFLITWGFVVLGLFPFGAFIPQGFVHGWKFLKRNNLVAFSLIISLVVIGFFSISSTKLPNYTLPAIPFLAIMVAGFFEEIQTFKTSKKWWNAVSLGLISLVTAAIPVAVFILFEHRLIAHLQLIFVAILSVIIGFGLYFIWKFYFHEKIQQWIVCIGVLWITLGLFIFYFIYPNLSKIEPVIQAEKVIENKEVVVFESYDPAFNFNYQRNFQEIHGEENLKIFSEQNPNVLILTKDKRVKDSKYIQENFQTIFNEPSVFENYYTVILKKW